MEEPADSDHTDSDHADWMSKLPEDTLLWDLAIPGSHDTMSYCLDTRSPVLGSESCVLRLLDHLAPCITRPCVVRWATTQAWRVSEQLNAGIRFLDLRIAHKEGGGDDTLYFAHGIYTLETVKDTPSLSHCWGRGQQVIVSYDNEEVVKKHSWLWPKIPYWYANKTTAQDVIKYLDQQKNKGRPGGGGEFFVAGLNLTENAGYVLRHPCQTMRTMTMEAFSALLGWLEEQNPGPGRTSLNIICGDFVGLNQFCSKVIALNKQLNRTLDLT